jgi:glycosyltransferase involved in cell wall biosynthesis
MKIAVFHNFMDNIGGAEIVTLFLSRGLNTDIYTTNIDAEQIKKMGFEDVLPRIISLGEIPKMAPFRHQLALWKFRKLNLDKKYGFYIISGDWAMSGAVNNKPNLWYVHSPLNELWAFKDYVRENVLTWWKRPIFDIWVWFNRKLTLVYSKHVNIWICNSNNTKNRITKYYNKEAAIINPPVDTTKHFYKNSENFWLSVNRLTKHKRIEIQMKAFSKLPNEKLIIVGSYEKGAKQFEDYKKYIESIKPPNVEIISWVDLEKLISLYNTCKGFITTAKDEDFGMTPVEAMASGKPVIAPNEGGYKETIIDGVTGLLIDNIDENKLIESIKKVGLEININPNKYIINCLEHSKKFDIKNFIEKIQKNILELNK